MSKSNLIITIGRQYGSAGYEIGKKLASDLGVKLYDKEMLKRAAKETGLCEELFDEELRMSAVSYQLGWQDKSGAVGIYCEKGEVSFNQRHWFDAHRCCVS